MFFRRLFSHLLAPPVPPPTFSTDLAGDDPAVLRAEMQACTHRDGGTLATVRRAQALAELFGKLTADGKQIYIDLLIGLDTAAPASAADRYSQIEEAELFGRSSSKLAILDAFERPTRRMLTLLNDSGRGAQVIAEIREVSPTVFQEDIDKINL